MESHTIKLLAHVIQDFQPILPFYTSIFLERKKFTTSELSNKILPAYFHASLASLLVGFVIIGVLGQSLSLLLILAMQLAMLVLLVLMQPRSLRTGQAIYALGGASSVYRTILRILLVRKGARADMQIGNIKMLRYVTAALSAWIGQGIYGQTGSYGINIALSFLSTVIAAGLTILDASSSNAAIDRGFLQTLASPLALAEALRSALTRELVMGILCGSASACLLIYMNIFSQTIFHEKAAENSPDADEEGLISRALMIIHIPVQCIAFVIIKLFSPFTAAQSAPQSPPAKIANIKSGYIEGTTKILSSIASMLIINFVALHEKQAAYMSFMSLAILFFNLLGRCKSLGFSEIVYFVALTFTLTAEILAKSYVHKSEQKVIICNLCLLLESVLHTAINFICRAKGLNATGRIGFYSMVACVALMAALLIKVTA